MRYGPTRPLDLSQILDRRPQLNPTELNLLTYALTYPTGKKTSFFPVTPPVLIHQLPDVSASPSLFPNWLEMGPGADGPRPAPGPSLPPAGHFSAAAALAALRALLAQHAPR